MSDGKLSLNLNEENELTFKIMIEGSTSDVNATKPHIRFVLSESGSSKAWLYPTSKDDEGNVVVNVSGEEHLNEEKDYIGQLEVILGNHYFVPTTVDIEFIKPLKVEAVVVSKNSSTLKEDSQKTNTVAVSTASVQVKTKKKVQEVAKPRTPRKRQWEDLTKEEQERVKKVLRERKRKELREAKALAEKKKKAQQLAEDTIKDQLKSLLSDSLKTR